MATNIIGNRDDSVRASRVVQNVLPKIILVDSNIQDAAFLAFYNRVKTGTTPQEKFTWDVDQFLGFTDTVDESGGVTASQTSFKVDTPKLFIPNQLWTNKRTGEVFQVDSVNYSSSEVTCTRAVTALESGGGTAAAAMVDADTLVRISSAVGEDSVRQATQSTTPAEVFNYTQQFRYELGLTRRQLKRAYENGDELPYQSIKAMKEARMDLNRAFLVGERGKYTGSDGTVTTTQGIVNVPSTYTWSVGGTLHEYDWDEFLVEEGLRKGSRNKILFASTQVILAISQMTKDRVEYTLNLGTKSQPVGISVMEYMAPNGGKLMVVEDRFLSEAFNGTAVGVDMDQLKRMVFSRNGYNDDLHMISDTQDKDDLGSNITIFGDMGLQYGAEETHFLITNVSGGAKGRAVA